MKRQIQTSYCRTIFLASMVALLPLSGKAIATAATEPATTPETVSPPATSPMTAPEAKLTAPTREVVKLINAGVPEGVVKSYVQNSPSTFNLNTDTIIHLRGMGVSEAVVVAMLSHDKSLRDTSMSASTAYQSPAAPQITSPPVPYTAYGQPQDNGYVSIPPDYSNYYDQSYPYNYGGYYPWGGYGYYPYYSTYGFYGGWWPGSGWNRFPQSRFRAFNRFGSRNFAGNQFGRGFNGGFNRSFSSFHGGFNGGGGVAHGGMGNFGGGHMSGGGHGGGGHR